ncbi:CAP domain-containing protein [Albidovulum sediminicola]|uniref:CAP domain-containing protein n=1 Tax=Albidovulum sediminicola TaxID=2984331 RepID=A0ABT2Z2J3_9RHOB|nr:CAP domain-containing protein [Defluviimonas sp. WL0075]MCV2865240.1 CAP domain-containing protein [Defluviimonas sp. WL0075]
MRKFLTILTILAATSGAASAAQCEMPGATGAELQAVLSAINGHRKAAGRAPLGRDAMIDAAAQAHACDMAVKANLTHNGNGGPKRRMRKAGCKARMTGEAIAMGQGNAAEVVQTWMDSPPHRKILLLAQGKNAGLGVARAANGRLYWVFDVANGC